jgi:hypothetical protein
MVTAVAADDLEHAGVAAFRPALRHAGRLAAENHHPAVPGLITGYHGCLLSQGSVGHLPTRHADLPPELFILSLRECSSAGSVAWSM